MTNAYIRAAKKHPKLKQQAAERLILSVPDLEVAGSVAQCRGSRDNRNSVLVQVQPDPSNS